MTTWRLRVKIHSVLIVERLTTVDRCCSDTINRIFQPIFMARTFSIRELVLRQLHSRKSLKRMEMPLPLHQPGVIRHHPLTIPCIVLSKCNSVVSNSSNPRPRGRWLDRKESHSLLFCLSFLMNSFSLFSSTPHVPCIAIHFLKAICNVTTHLFESLSANECETYAVVHVVPVVM